MRNRELRRRAAWRRRVLAVAVVAAFAVAMGGWLSDGDDDGDRAAAEARAPAALARTAARTSRLVGRIAESWVDRRSDTGLFVDPITGGSRHGYGPAMLAEVLIRTGAQRGDRRMLRAGLRALAENARRAASDGDPGNPLELLAIGSAYRWAERNLAGDADWKRFRRAPRQYLASWESAGVGLLAERCFASPTCWNNYKVIDAAAVLLLLQTRLQPASDAALLADPARARARALAVLDRDLAAAIGRQAEARGRSATLRGLGLLTDEPNYPLAYHAMSVAGLARALQVLGDAAPAAAREHFRRAMLAQASFMAPDGDVSYMGRAQGESWALAATAYAGASCARTFRASNPRSAGICATLASRAVKRLRRMHGFRRGLLAIVPRFSQTPLTRAGLAHYARVMTFNGLTGVLLAWAADESRAARAVAPAPLPLDAGGAFVDRDRSRLAAVRRGRLWFAVHANGPAAGTDLRYDFGLVALKLRRRDRWVDVLPPRPFAEGLDLDSGGPVLVTPAGTALPHGRRLEVDAGSGEVVVHGDYRLPDGGVALGDVRFRYRPLERGVRITTTAPAGSVLRFQDFLPAAWTEVVDAGAALRTPTATSRLSEAPTWVERGTARPSAYGVELAGFARYLTVPAGGSVSWTVRARPLR